MDATTSIKPMTMAELMPGLSGILSRDCIQTLKAKKQPRSTMAQTRTAENVMKPLTIAEMRASILALKVQSPRRYAQGDPSTKKKNWNSSVKVDKTVSHTANGQMKNNPVRKVLNFQAKPKTTSSTRATMAAPVYSPKSSKPDFRPKKSVLIQARNNIRISGICNIPETSVINKPNKSRMTLANKEKISNQSLLKKAVTAKVQKKLTPIISEPRLSNESWKSSCDASFLQKEKEIDDIENITKAITSVNSDKISTELKDLLEIEKQTEHYIKMIESSITTLNKIKESKQKSLQYVKKLIKEKNTVEDHDKTVTDSKETLEEKTIKSENVRPERKAEPSKSCSVRRSSKSPSYKIPKKNLCLRKVFCKSKPNVSNDNMLTPVKSAMGNRALSMYLKMKENMNFLNTPIAKRQQEVPDTPAVTSNNLQHQLDKLYG